MLFWATALATTAPLPSVAWDWDPPQRFLVESEVQLPQRMWMEAEFNRSVRAAGWQIQAVLTCQGTDKQTERQRRVRCAIDAIALRVATVAGDQGRALPVLDEYDRVLTGAALVVDMHEDGRLLHFKVEGVPSRNLRGRGRIETLRLLLRSIVVGFELRLPRDGESTWLFRQTQLCQMPTLWGTLAPVDGVSVGRMREGQVLEIASSAKGLMSPGNSANLVTCFTTERAFFSPGRGLTRHTWEMEGDLTPGSPGSFGQTTIPYMQRGRLVRLSATEQPRLFATDEYIPGGVLRDTLHGGDAPPSFKVR